MADILRSSIKALIGKVETVTGVEEVPDPLVNGIEIVENASWTNPRAVTQNAEFNGSLDPGDPTIGVPIATFDFSFDLKGSGVAGTAPRWAEFMRMAGVTITPGTLPDQVVISFNSLAETMTLYGYIDGVLRKGVGCVASSLTLTFTANGRWRAAMTAIGRDGGLSDAALPAITQDGTTAPIWRNNRAQIATVESPIQQFTINYGLRAQTYDDPSPGQNGILIALLGGRELTGQMNPTLELVATKDWDTIIDANTKFAIGLTNGTNAGNIIAFDAPNVLAMNTTPTDDTDLMRNQIDLQFTGADAGFTITTS